MEFRQLEYFCMISKLENFTRAAEMLHVSQPSVTKAIKALEAELKIVLIDRSQKRVALTPEGKAFLVHAEKILRAVNDALHDMSKYQTHEQGSLKLGISPLIEGYIFPDIFTSFKTKYPNVELNILEYPSSSNVQMKIEEGEIDLGIVLCDAKETKFNQFVIMQDELSLCVHRGHPLEEEKSVHFSQLKKEKFILQPPNTYHYKEVFARCAQNDFTPDVLFCTAQLKTIKQLVANKSGISILLNLVTRNEPGFTAISIDPPMPVAVSLVWSANKCLSQASQSFVEFIREYVESPSFKAQYEQK